MYISVKCTDVAYPFTRYYPISTDTMSIWNPPGISFNCYFFVLFSRRIYNLSVLNIVYTDIFYFSVKDLIFL